MISFFAILGFVAYDKEISNAIYNLVGQAFSDVFYRVISAALTFIITEVVVKRVARIVYSKYNNRFVNNMYFFSWYEIYMSVYGLFIGTFNAFFKSIILKNIKDIINYVRLDYITSSGFNTYLAMIKAETYHQHPVISVAAHKTATCT